MKGPTSINLSTMAEGFKNIPKNAVKQKEFGLKDHIIQLAALSPVLKNEFLSALISIRIMEHREVLGSPTIVDPLKSAITAANSPLMTRIRRTL